MIELDMHERAFLVAALRILEGFQGVRAAKAAADAFAVDFTFETSASETRAARIRLGQLFQETEGLASEARLSELALRLAGLLSAEQEPSWADLAPHLFPLLRPTSFRGGLPTPLVRVQFLPLLHAHAAFDDGATQRLLVPEDAARFEKSFVELLAIALGNLAGLEHALDSIEGAPGVARIANDDGYQAARLLLPGFLASVASELGGPVVCAVPNAGTLLFALDDDKEALRGLLELAESEWRGHPDAISPVPYALSAEGTVVPFDPPPESALFEPLRRAHVLFLTQTYADQRASLLEAAEESGQEIAIATCGATSHPELGAVTTTHLLEGLIPVTDLVFLVWQEGESEQALLVDRDDLLRLSPNRLVPAPDFDPPLYCALSFPNDEELGALDSVALWSAAEGG